MFHRSLSLLTLLLLVACGSGPAPPPPPPTLDDLMVISAESNQALVFNKSSPFGQQAIKRTVISSQDDLMRLGQIGPRSKLAIQFSKSATPAQMRQFAQYSKTALRNPRNAAVLGALLGTGVVASYILLDDEPDAPSLDTPDPTRGVKTIPIQASASNQDLLEGLKTYKLPKATLDAVSSELRLTGTETPANNALIKKAFLLPKSSQEAKIENVQFSRSLKNNSIMLDINITGQITNRTRTLVKARFFDETRTPLLSPNSNYTNPQGQVEVERELIGVISRNKFHAYTQERPLTLSVPAAVVQSTGANPAVKCRIEVFHKSSGKLMAATAALPIF